jgi:hypothetical protein
MLHLTSWGVANLPLEGGRSVKVRLDTDHTSSNKESLPLPYKGWLTALVWGSVRGDGLHPMKGDHPLIGKGWLVFLIFFFLLFEKIKL